jgi:hypothetical protein
MPLELVTLLNLLCTAVLALTLTFVIQGVLVCCWRHLVNRRYYQQQRDITRAAAANDAEALRKALAHEVGKERMCCGVFGPRRQLKPPKFFPCACPPAKASAASPACAAWPSAQ